MRAILILLAAIGQEQPAAISVPDPSWSPSVGATGVAFSPGRTPIYGAIDGIAEDRLHEALAARDEAGLRELLDSREVLPLANKTPILVVAAGRESRRMAVRQGVVMRGGVIVGTKLAQVPVTTVHTWAVRVLDGPDKGARVILPASQVVRLREGRREVARPTPRPKARPRTLAPTSAAREASAAFREARKLEADGHPVEAVAAYRKFVADFPAAPEARLARARVEALAGK